VKSLFALAAALWFAFNAVSYALNGDKAAITVDGAAGILFVGLAILSLAFVNWGAIWKGLWESRGSWWI
jgi:hypothetical protein